MFDLSKYIVHDLTHTLDNQIDGFAAEQARTVDIDGWNAKTLTIYSHAGTHMDAPYHFGVSDQTIDDFTPKELMGQAWIVDILIEKGRQLIGLEVVKNQLDQFIAGDSILLRTNWSSKYDQENFKSDLPRISKELAAWFVAQEVKLLGVEPLSVADVNDLQEVTEIHQILLGGKVIIIEGLKNLHLIKAKKVFLIALPLKVRDGDGAPCRVIAFETKIT